MSAFHSYNSSKVNKVISLELKDKSKLHEYYSYNLQVANSDNDNAASPDHESHDVMLAVSNDHPEAYYLYFIAISGMLLNIIVVMAIFIRKPLRKMTSGFLVHACFLDFSKSAYCIPIGTNLLSQTKPTDCDFFGATFVILITISVFNMVAMVCTEAYTFGEKNIGGNSKGTAICIMFGVVLVYIGSMILHLGPTLIGGHFEFQPDIGTCSFTFGKQTGYVAHVMWAFITTVAMIAAFHFIRRLYKEIQINRPNRVSFLVRTSITVMDTASSSTCRLRMIIKDATHRAKLFIVNTTLFILCWYPYFLLIIIDKNFKVSPKLYQAFAFIAWSHGAFQPIVYILFDRNLNLLAKYIYCDEYNNTDNIIQRMMHRQRALDQTDRKHRYGSADSESLSPYPTNHNSVNRNNLVDIIREHQEMYVVQNSSNQDVHNRATNTNIEILDLTNQSFSCSTIPPGVQTDSDHANSDRGFNNTVDNPTYINRSVSNTSEGFEPSSSRDFVRRLSEDFVPRSSQDFVLRSSQDFVPRSSQGYLPRLSEDSVPRSTESVLARSNEGVLQRSSDESMSRKSKQHVIFTNEDIIDNDNDLNEVQF